MFSKRRMLIIRDKDKLVWAFDVEVKLTNCLKYWDGHIVNYIQKRTEEMDFNELSKGLVGVELKVSVSNKIGATSDISEIPKYLVGIFAQFAYSSILQAHVAYVTDVLGEYATLLETHTIKTVEESLGETLKDYEEEVTEFIDKLRSDFIVKLSSEQKLEIVIVSDSTTPDLELVRLFNEDVERETAFCKQLDEHGECVVKSGHYYRISVQKPWWLQLAKEEKLKVIRHIVTDLQLCEVMQSARTSKCASLCIPKHVLEFVSASEVNTVNQAKDLLGLSKS